jgi:hypothetical protein
MAAATIKAVRDFFNEGSTQPLGVREFTDQWKLMSDTDKEQIKEGIGNGTLTY